jgi:hypothetical protein
MANMDIAVGGGFLSHTHENDPERPHVAFLGKMGAGKTDAALFFQHLNGYCHLSFATKLKAGVREIFGTADRDKLQRTGAFARSLDPDVFIKRLHGEWDQLGPQASIAVDDCRMENEYMDLASHGFIFVRIEAPEDARIERLQYSGKFQSLDQLHDVTETAIDHLPAQFTIQNDGSAQDFNRALEDLALKLKRRV